MTTVSNKVYIAPMRGQKSYAFTLNSKDKPVIEKTNNKFNDNSLGLVGVSGAPSPRYSGIAYDNGLVYLGTGSEIYAYDKNTKTIKKHFKKLNDYTGQDIGAYSGFILSIRYQSYSIDNNKKKKLKNPINYIDIIRESDGAYVGSYKLTIPGEVESAVIWNGKLVLVSNSSDRITIFKSGAINLNKDCTK